MKLRIFYILAFFVALSACKKDDIESFPHVLKGVKISQKGDIRLYTTGGAEIKNKSVIQQFTNQWSDPVADYNPGVDIITFSSKDTITFGTSNLKYSVQRKGDRFLFYSEYPVFLGIERAMDPYLAYTSEIIPIDATSGYDPRRKDVRVAYGNNNNFRLSFLLYKIKRSDGYNFSITQGGLYNEINKSSLRDLQQGDTLAVQEFTINYKN
ncbi:hypothetical protein IM792_00025 [Mucilaginibacter sp. JRF]|uniref:hypothetical protein n=1 Tax=Mucilaginibacter sp. JRF TaxID=2780088 RepID=UPI00187EDB49|nr:hypothetical protein [Mucilaginibacter sp. JRF]MBE9582822.1 hypothetical protein [Mucilaginibacter sp. JRF]